MNVGVLTAERDGPDIKFTMQLPDAHDHFMVERFDKIEVADGGERIEVWKPIHPGTRKWVNCGVDAVGVDFERAARIDDLGRPIDNPDPVPGGRFRAMALYQFTEPGTQVRHLATDGVYTGIVTVP
jgi:hypothetical protein